MTAHADAPSAAGRTSVSTWSRIYGLGSVYAKTLRDSRLAFLIVGGLLCGFMLSGAAAFGQAYATLEARQDLANLVNSLPPVMQGLYGTPHPLNIETLGGSLGWKTGPSLALTAGLWSVFALGSTLAGEARRGSLEFVAVTPFGKRRIALEKLAAHLTVMGLIVVALTLTTTLSSSVFGSLPGDEIPLDRALGFSLWVGLCGLASGAVAFALAPFLGRAGAIGVGGLVLVIGYFVNGYSSAVPAFGGIANLTWFGWTANHLPLSGQSEWLTLIPVALVAAGLMAVGVEAFARRDLGVTLGLRMPGMPGPLLGLSGPGSRSFGERLPLALWWGIGIGVFGFIFGAAAASFIDALSDLSPETFAIFKTLFPNIDLSGAGGFLQLVFIEFGYILVGFAAATLVAGWGSDESSGRFEMLLTSPLGRARLAMASGAGVMAAIVVMTSLVAAGIAVGSAITGGDVATPVSGTLVLGLYAAALAGIGLAFGGLWRSSWAGEVVAGFVIVTFVIALVGPALELPNWFQALALTTHMGQPMIGTWDWAGIAACLALAIGGIGVSAWGLARRDVSG